MDMDIQKVDRSRVKAFFAFDIMVLPFLVKVMFILGLIGIVLTAAAIPFKMATGFGLGPREEFRSEFSCGTFALASLFSGVFMLLAIVWWRVMCESMIILFKIREDLSALRGPVPAPAAAPPAPPPAAPEKPPALPA